MFKPSELRGLISAMRASGATTLEVRRSEQRLRLVLTATASTTPEPAQAPVSVGSSLNELPPIMVETVTSPTIGTFHRRGLDDGLLPLEPGRRLVAGDVLGYVCHGLVRTVVNAPVSGILRDQGPEDGEALGMGDTVFNLEVAT